MVLAPWRSPLAKALHLNRSLTFSRYFQLATITLEGKPANRTVVFRGFFKDTNIIQIITDSRSQKIEEIQHQNWGEICWYFPKTREQFRISGKLNIVKENCEDETLKQARITTWKNLSDSARVQFAWPAPKKARNEDNRAFEGLEVLEKEPVENFDLLLFNPEAVDRLELRGEPQNRWLYALDNDSQTWATEWVNP